MCVTLNYQEMFQDKLEEDTIVSTFYNCKEDITLSLDALTIICNEIMPSMAIKDILKNKEKKYIPKIEYFFFSIKRC